MTDPIPFPRLYRLEWRGDTEVRIDGCRGIVRYNATTVCLRMGGGLITITGSNLTISELSEQALTVRGRIDSVSRC